MSNGPSSVNSIRRLEQIPKKCLTSPGRRPTIPSMSLESASNPDDQERLGQRRRLLDDPLSIRALAHPLRLELQSIVGRSGKITAADAARELGISHALASHHLRPLAKYGFVEQG